MSYLIIFVLLLYQVQRYLSRLSEDVLYSDNVQFVLKVYDTLEYDVINFATHIYIL